MTGELFIGIDGGGSKCKARLVDTVGGRTGAGIAGPANPFQNIGQTRESVVSAAQQALADADGAVIVAGTGSVGYASVGGLTTTVGAHGFPFGDKGSGAWMGLEAMKAVLLAVDRLGADTALVTAIQVQLEASGLDIIDAMAGAQPRDYGALAPLVLAAAGEGDKVALGIVREGAGYLEQVAQRLLAAGAPRLCMLGGLAPAILPWMNETVTRHVVPPQGQPDTGALHFARDCHAEGAITAS